MDNIKKVPAGTPKYPKQPDANPPGYPLYPASDDIYNHSTILEDVDPDDITQHKARNEDDRDGLNNEKDFHTDLSGSDLDIPGAELDDEQEGIGNEDEENNYYSLGGDSHDDLEEDQGAPL
jgi:hypothetical protein